jgi:hypothetical protein
LKEGKVSPLPTALRNSATPEDAPVLDRLRSGCPARKTDEPVDVDVAVKLVENGALYRQALNLAVMAETAIAPKEGRAWAASAFALELPPHSSPHTGPLSR